jgi:transposase
MGKTMPPYPAEFKEEAVRLTRSSGKSVAQIARDLGVSFESLRHWVKQAAVDDGSREGLTTDERSELTKLRRENQTLRQEREVLKKAAAFFARESESR